jgi:ABC-type transport system involved in multi-copper enzyme maturation permease subunit
MNAIVARLWLWFWHLLPANPILVRVVQGASRRQRHLWLRIVYLAALLGVVMFSLILSLSQQSASLAELAKGASKTFQYGSMVQLAMMCLLAPVFTAAAITQERDAQTFNILLATPLTNSQIVFGSLISRLYFVIMLLVAGLPIFFMTMVYGGVTGRQVLESFALSGSTAILTGALAIFVAMVRVGTRRTIFSFYLTIALYLLAVYLLGRWGRTWVEASPANIGGQQMSWLTPLHPFLALDVALNIVYPPPYSDLTGHSTIIRYALAYPSAVYVTWTTALAFILTVFSVLFVRRGAKTGEATLLNTIIERLTGRVSGERTRPPKNVWANPVAWREAKGRSSSGGPLRWGLILGGLTASVLVFFYHVGGDLKADSVREWLVGLMVVQFALALIIATNTAATSMTKEKESKTMDLLLVTPVTSKYILWGKLRGLVSFALPLLLGPAVVLLAFGVYGIFSKSAPAAVWIESAIEVAALMVIYTAVACVIGLRISLISKTNVTAVMSSVGLMILLCGIASLIGFPLATSAGGEFGAFLAPFSPFTSISYIVNPRWLFDTDADFARGLAAARTAAFIGSIIATTLYAFFVWTIYSGLVRNFDMIVRKQSGT